MYFERAWTNIEHIKGKMMKIGCECKACIMYRRLSIVNRNATCDMHEVWSYLLKKVTAFVRLIIIARPDCYAQRSTINVIVMDLIFQFSTLFSHLFVLILSFSEFDEHRWILFPFKFMFGQKKKFIELSTPSFCICIIKFVFIFLSILQYFVKYPVSSA